MPGFLFVFLWSLSSIFGGSVAVGFRYSLAKAKSKALGDSCYFGKYTIVKSFCNLSIGNNVAIHDFCYIDALGECEIGDNVSVAHGVSIVTFDHTWAAQSLPIKYNPAQLKKIVIEEDVWIGCGARILAGVRIGSRSVVAAGAVVTQDVPSRTVVAGVPAKVVKSI